jgi:hypothetical protein
MLCVSADNVHRLPTAGLHNGENSKAVRHEILSGADAHRVAGEIRDHIGGKPRFLCRFLQNAIDRIAPSVASSSLM